MHWTEVAAIVIIVAALVPVVIFLFYIGAFAWGGVRYWIESRRVDLGHEYRCEQGLFVRKMHGWEGETEWNGKSLKIEVRDVNGAPDLPFLGRLPDVIAKLPELERIAR